VVDVTVRGLGSGRIRSDQVICYPVFSHHLGKTTDEVSRKAAAGKREGMSTEQLLQMPAVRTDSFNIAGFVTYSTKGTVIKQNLQITESNTSDIYMCVPHYPQ